jgi:ABC-type lipoprotein release transport system permease subunit
VALGGLGFALALVGVFGVTSYTAKQRSREIGIRMALGAPKSAIRTLVLCQGLIVLCAGLATGIMASLASAPVVRRFLVGISATDLCRSDDPDFVRDIDRVLHPGAPADAG